MSFQLQGLVAATHSPFHQDGQLNLDCVEQQADHLIRNGVETAFICGTTGESHSLTVEERLALAARWASVVRGTPLRLVVHVGANCLADARQLAMHAARTGAAAISMLAPSYFKPTSIDSLIACCAEVASGAPEVPFYFYDIPGMTGVQFPMPDFLPRAVKQIPSLRGLKFTNPDLKSYQLCLRAGAGQFDVPWGVDEYLLAAVVLGARGAVGSSYNFAAPVYQQVLDSFHHGDLETARIAQFRSVQLIEVLGQFGYLPAAKVVMEILGVPVGPPRLPLSPLIPDAAMKLRSALEQLGFFDWIRL